MTATRPPLMVRLGHAREQAGIPQNAVAAQLGVHRDTVYQWEAGQRSPHYAHAVGYAHHIEQQIILHDGQHILARGADIPAALPRLRAAARISRRQLAETLHVTRQAVTAAETRGYELLAGYEAHARGLGLTIAVQACQPAERGVAA